VIKKKLKYNQEVDRRMQKKKKITSNDRYRYPISNPISNPISRTSKKKSKKCKSKRLSQVDSNSNHIEMKEKEVWVVSGVTGV